MRCQALKADQKGGIKRLMVRHLDFTLWLCHFMPFHEDFASFSRTDDSRSCHSYIHPRQTNPIATLTGQCAVCIDINRILDGKMIQDTKRNQTGCSRISFFATLSYRQDESVFKKPDMNTGISFNKIGTNRQINSNVNLKCEKADAAASGP